MKTVGDAVTAATLDALRGPHLLRLNPTFLQDFWAFDRNLQTYMQGKSSNSVHDSASLTYSNV
jgi:hypothetical protein